MSSWNKDGGTYKGQWSLITHTQYSECNTGFFSGGRKISWPYPLCKVTPPFSWCSVFFLDTLHRYYNRYYNPTTESIYTSAITGDCRMFATKLGISFTFHIWKVGVGLSKQSFSCCNHTNIQVKGPFLQSPVAYIK